eukprot:scaffold3.g6516.t1
MWREQSREHLERLGGALRRRAFAAKSVAQKLDAAGGMHQCLGATDLIFLGIGSIIGAGVYVLTGVAAAQHAGPAVVLSFMIAALAALLSALCYSEFAVEIPVSGGAYNYISVTFGELAAWLTSWNMCLETTLSSAAVARGFASYLATLCGLKPADVRIQLGPLEIDFTALFLIAMLTAILSKGTKESARFNQVVVSCNVGVILFVLAVGLPLASTENLHPFMPFGARGMFSAASIVFFSYVGFDYLANSAEEALDPAHTLPLGLLVSLSIATSLYALMAAALVMMVPYTVIDVNSPFAAAFIARGYDAVGRVVSAGAVFGIVASTMTGLLGQARLFVVLGRERLLPGWLAAVHPRTGTPVKAQLLTGAASGLLAVAIDISVLAELVSVGTLFVFAMVCAAVVHRRYYQPGRTPSAWPVLLRLLAIVCASAGASMSFTFGGPWVLVLVFLALWMAASASLLLLPLAHVPPRFTVPLFPLTPCAGVLCTVHLIGSLGWPAYVRFGVWVAIGLGVYCAYGIHAAEQHEQLQAMQRAAAEEEAAAAEADGGDEALELPFRLPALDHEAAVVDDLHTPGRGPSGSSAAVELAAWPATAATRAGGGDRAALLPAGHSDSAAAANGQP